MKRQTSLQLTIAMSLGFLSLIVGSMSASVPQSESEYGIYRRAVQQYASGQIESAITLVTALPERTIDGVLTRVRRGADWSRDSLRAAAMLHTDVFRIVVTNNLPTWRIHLRTAQSLIEMAWDANDSEFTRRWYLLAGYTLQAELRLIDLKYHLQAMSKHFARQPDYLRLEATLYEIAASPFGRSDNQSPFPGRNERDLRAKAVAIFEAALVVEPNLPDAQLHLSKLLLDSGKFGEAVAYALKVRRGTTVVEQQYLASLFAGAAFYSLRDFNKAEDSYRLAVSLLPDCQTPWLGLAQSVRKTDPVAAKEMILAVARRGPLCDDPWWQYRLGPRSDETLKLLDALRGQVRAR